MTDWINVKDELPKENNTYYWVTKKINNGYLTTEALFSNGMFYTKGPNYELIPMSQVPSEVIAWMEMPEPYKEDD